MQSVCKEHDRLEHHSAPGNERREIRLQSSDSRRKRRQTCTCKLKHNNTYTEMRPNSTWKVVFERVCINHHRTCPLFASPASTTTAKIRIKNCGDLLAGAIEASVSIIRGAGGSAISPVLQCARVVSQNNPAFALVSLKYNFPAFYLSLNGRKIRSIREWQSHLKINIQQLARMFCDGRASPYDVDLNGNTLLHVRVTLSRNKQSLTSTQAASQGWEIISRLELHDPALEPTVSSLIRLEELCVPPNWTNDFSL